MRAIVIHAAKDLRVEERKPETAGPGEVEVAIEAGGICARTSTILLQPRRLRHRPPARADDPRSRGAGRIVAIGAGVHGLSIGERVAVSPSRPCGACDYCIKGLPNQFLDMRFYGPAMPFPHIQGAFRERLVARVSQCHKVDDGIAIGEATLAEPCAVTLHAVDRAGSLLDKRVLVTGCGPIGALAIIAARAYGAREIVATDVSETIPGFAGRIGADRTINVATNPEALAAYGANKGSFDVQFEASGNAAAIRSGVDVLRPRGVLVQLGLGDDIAIPQNLVVAGKWRFAAPSGSTPSSVSLSTSSTVVGSTSHRF